MADQYRLIYSNRIHKLRHQRGIVLHSIAILWLVRIAEASQIQSINPEIWDKRLNRPLPVFLRPRPAVQQYHIPTVSANLVDNFALLKLYPGNLRIPLEAFR